MAIQGSCDFLDTIPSILILCSHYAIYTLTGAIIAALYHSKGHQHAAAVKHLCQPSIFLAWFPVRSISQHTSISSDNLSFIVQKIS
jgi:hypothetical protein